MGAGEEPRICFRLRSFPFHLSSLASFPHRGLLPFPLRGSTFGIASAQQRNSYSQVAQIQSDNGRRLPP